MIKKILSSLSLPLLILATPAMADWPVAVADQFVVHQSHRTNQLGLLKNDVGSNLKLAGVNEWSENGARIRILNNEGRNSRIDGYVYGDVSYKPRRDFVGRDGFWYVIEDDQGRKNAIRVVVDVRAEDSPLPAPLEDFVDVPKDTSIRINALSNDLFSDLYDSGRRSFRGVIVDYNYNSEKGGKVEKVEIYPDETLRFGGIGVNGFQFFENTFRYQFKYTPPAGFTGTDTFTYAVRDSKDSDGNSMNDIVKWTKVTLNVGAGEKGPAPIAFPDKVSLTFNRFIFEKNIDVLKNDQGKHLLIKLDSAYSQKGGRLQIVPNYANHPVILYDAPFDQGEDRIWYSIEDEYGRKNFSYVDVTVDFDAR